MKIMSFLFAVAIATSVAHAQETQQSSAKIAGWSLAPSLSLTSFKIKSDAAPQGSRSGVGAGVSALIPSTENLSYEVGLQYFEAGAKDSALFFETETTLSYLAIPVAAQWNFAHYGDKEQNAFYLVGGASIAFLTSAKSKASGFGLSSESDIKDQVNSYDLLARAGIGGSHVLSETSKLNYELSYLRGTQKVFKNEASHNEGYLASLTYAMQM